MLDLNKLHEAVRHEGGISRRLLLAYGAALSSVPLLGRHGVGIARAAVLASNNPFSLGVASGEPDDSSVVLWTRLAPEPLAPAGGMTPEPVRVQWEIGEDEAMKKVVQRGVEIATPQLGHSVHAIPRNLRPDRWYWFRFRTADAESPIGRTRTLPAPDAEPGQLRFALGSCQHYESGYYTAYEQMTRDELDLVIFVGDYVYEGGRGRSGLRLHVGDDCQTLEDYRIRYSLYRSDPLLKGMHALCPWLVTPDDHEVQNNWAGEVSERRDANPADFLVQRAAAFQAYYEMMPLRRRSLPRGPDMRLYRRSSFGRLADLFVLDTRQYRSPLLKGEEDRRLGGEAYSPARTLMGPSQRNWLYASLLRSRSTWNVLAQQVMMGMYDRNLSDGTDFSMDQWPGYAYEREGLLRFMSERRVPNPVILTGDIHSNWVNDLRLDDRKMELPVVATEFVGTSISSSGKQRQPAEKNRQILSQNPFVKFQNAERGYMRCTLTPKTWTTDIVEVEDVTQPASKVYTRATYAVEAGRPGAVAVGSRQ